MARLTLDEVKEIGIAAARRVIGDDFNDVDVVAGADHVDRDAYFFTYRFDDAEERNKAGKLTTKLMIAIIDDLCGRGDESFPFVRMLSDMDCISGPCCSRVSSWKERGCWPPPGQRLRRTRISAVRYRPPIMPCSTPC